MDLPGRPRRTRSGPRPGPGSRRTWPRGGPSAAASRRRATRADGFAQHLDWERRLFADRWAVVSWPAGARRPRRVAVGVAALRGGVLPGRRARPGSRRTASSCWPRAIFEFGTPEQQDGILRRMAGGRGPLVPGLVGAQRRQRPGQRHQPGPTRSTAAGCSTGRRPGPPAARSARTCSACSAPTPTAPATRASPTSSCRSTRRASPCAASVASTATRASPRCSSTTPSSPTTPCPAAWCSASPRAAGPWPWPPPAPSAASRCARPAASSPPPSGSSPSPRERRRRRAAAPGRHRLDARRGLPAADARRRSRSWPRAPRPAPRPASPSCGGRELDIELHEIALDLLGPDAELEGPWSKGWQFSLSGPIYAGTNEIQRNIAAERLLGLPR